MTLDRDWIIQKDGNDNPVAIVKNLVRIVDTQISNLSIEESFKRLSGYSTLQIIQHLLNEWMFDTNLVKTDVIGLSGIISPVITLLGDKYVLVTKVSSYTVTYLDTELGWRKDSLSVFKQKWTGFLLFATPSDYSGEVDCMDRMEQERIQLLLHPTRKKVRVIDNFVNPEGCGYLQEVSRNEFQADSPYSRLKKSCGVSGSQKNSFFLKNEDLVAQHLLANTSLLLDIPSTYFENINFSRHLPASSYSLQYDSVCQYSDSGKNRIRQYRQRIYTLFVFLNDDYIGGDVYFPRLNLKIPAKVGRAILFNNVNQYGDVDTDSFYAHLPVCSGEKFVSNIWVRNKCNQSTPLIHGK